MVDIELTQKDIEIISSYIKKIPDRGTYLEIGVKFGGSASLARGVNPDINVYGVDPDSERLSFYDFNFINLTSLEAIKDWKRDIDVLFIDGDHNMAMEDFTAWKKFIAPEGYVIFHDYSSHSPEVIRDCDEIEKYDGWKLIVKPAGIYQEPSSLFIIQQCPK